MEGIEISFLAVRLFGRYSTEPDPRTSNHAIRTVYVNSPDRSQPSSSSSSKFSVLLEYEYYLNKQDIPRYASKARLVWW